VPDTGVRLAGQRWVQASRLEVDTQDLLDRLCDGVSLFSRDGPLRWHGLQGWQRCWRGQARRRAHVTAFQRAALGVDSTRRLVAYNGIAQRVTAKMFPAGAFSGLSAGPLTYGAM
jgi:hypothetical protein